MEVQNDPKRATPSAFMYELISFRFRTNLNWPYLTMILYKHNWWGKERRPAERQAIITSTKDVSQLYWVLKAGSEQILASISDSFLEKVSVEWQSHCTLVTLSNMVWTHSDLCHAVQRTYFDILPEVLRSRHRKLLLLLGSTTAATATTSSRQGLDLPKGLQESARVMVQPVRLIQHIVIRTCKLSWELMYEGQMSTWVA